MIFDGISNSHAAGIAALIHHGQIRRGGQDYIEHCRRVAHRVRDGLRSEGLAISNSWFQIIVMAAWLHDAREDQPDRWGLIYRCLDIEVYKLVNVLTHPPDEPYGDYIARVIAAGPNAARIKWADLCDNLSDRPSDAARVRYGQALDAIRAAFPCAAWQVQPYDGASFDAFTKATLAEIGKHLGVPPDLIGGEMQRAEMPDPQRVHPWQP